MRVKRVTTSLQREVIEGGKCPLDSYPEYYPILIHEKYWEIDGITYKKSGYPVLGLAFQIGDLWFEIVEDDHD